MSGFIYEKDSDGIVTVTMDLPGPVNAMGENYDAAMLETIQTLEADLETGTVTGVVFTSAKKTFIVGADLNMIIDQKPGEEHLFFDFLEANKKILRNLEKYPVPIVAAINGAAMGGGFEFCLSCNHRIAWNNRSVQIALPEINFGLLAGAGGVVRSTCLVGIETALPFNLKGRPLTPAKALEQGLIHETVDDLEDLVPRAKAWILENKDNPEAAVQPWDRKGYKVPGGNINNPKIAQYVMAAPQGLLKETRGLIPAAERILEICVEAITTDIDTALLVETRKFLTLLASPVAKNMLTAFFFNMNAVNGGIGRPKDVPPTEIKKVGVLGAGMMGQGIANVSAKAGYQVILKDITMENAEKGKAYTAMLMDKQIAKGRADEAKKQALLDLITPTDKDEDLEGCDLIIEAVFEELDLKDKILKDTESRLGDSGIWGSNTSSLPITRLAEAGSKPENFIGLHYFSPVDKMPCVEIICGEKTSDETLAKAYDYVVKIRKTPIVVNDGVGFFTTRVIEQQAREALQLVGEGVHPIRVESLSRAVGMPVPQLQLFDELNMKTVNTIQQTNFDYGFLKEEDDPRPEGTALICAMEREYGRPGRIAGAGFYDYDDEGKRQGIWQGLLDKYFKPEVDEAISDEDIKDRLMLSNVVDSLRCLEEGVLRTVAEANIGSIMGIGAPFWTGGYIQFVNTYGLQRFIDRCDELAAKYGEHFKAPGIVAEKLAAGETFQ